MADITREELLESLREKRKSFQHVNLSGLDLRGIDMQRLDFTGCSFVGARLAGNRMAEGLFNRADFREADLGHCNLEGAHLEHAVLVSANLVEAVLSEARMAKANLRGADLTRAVVARADLSGADLTRAMLTNADFRGARMAGALFVGASMRGTLMREAEISPVVPPASDPVLAPQPLPPLRMDPRPAPPVVIPAPRPVPEVSLPINQVPAPRPKPASLASEPQPGASQGARPQGLMAKLMGRPAKEAAPVPAPRGYRPPVRPLPAVVYTEGGWITGQFSLPLMHGFLEYLNRKGELLKLQEVTHPLVQKELAFFGLRSEMAIMVVPKCEEAQLNLSPITGQTDTHRISFFMDRRVIHGDLSMEAGVRTSDYLNKGRWVLLRDCKVESLGGNAPGQVVTFPLLLLNTTTVLGISDENWGGWE